ncbi:MAG: GAF domain-containing sensor histidine kinase [Planctomycetota bacterium]
MSESVATPQVDQSHLEKVSWELLETYEALSTVYRSAELLASMNQTEKAVQLTLETSIDITDSGGGVIFLPDGQELQCKAKVNAGEDICRVALERFAKYKNRAYYEDGPIAGLKSEDGADLKGSLYVPFFFDDWKGMIFLFSPSKEEYSSIDVKMIQTLCCQGALTIRCFQSMEELQLKNMALEEAFDQLKLAQDELVKSERMSALGQAASMIVHNLKNPMGGLLGYAQLLESMSDRLKPEQVKEYSGIIISEMRRLSGMTEEIVDFSRGMETKLNQREVTSRNIVASAVPALESEFSGRKISFDWNHVDDEATLLCDTDKMERVFVNLAENACRTMNEGGAFAISSEVKDKAVIFSISDTGQEIEPEVRANIFEPFKNAEKGTGMGVGLAVARWVVESHNGEIWLDSTGEQGNCFKVKLPVYQGTQE